MRTFAWRGFCVLAFSAGVVALATIHSAAAGSPPEPPGIRTVATVRQVMHAMTIPSSDALFNVSVEPPRTEDDWVALANHAATLAESGNLLMLGNRVQEGEQWLKMARALVDVGADALAAAEAHDAKPFTAVGDRLLEVCQQCHDVYLK
jgi:hypothetical protein